MSIPIKMTGEAAQIKTIILIGPEGSGKSTIGKLIADSEKKELYSLDRHRDELYAPYGYDKALADKIYDEQGLWPFYEHWKTFEFQAVSHILQNASKEGDEFHSKILDFGAGHSVYEKPEQLAKIEGLIKPFHNVVLLLPCEDVEEALKITEARRGHELGLNRHFLEHESNRRLAKHVIYTHDKTPQQCADEVLRLIK
jgi:shikimate kinase